MHWAAAPGGNGGILEFMSPGFKAKHHPDVQLSKLPVVACMPLQYILDK